jgi:hypothetical protein
VLERPNIQGYLRARSSHAPRGSLLVLGSAIEKKPPFEQPQLLDPKFKGELVFPLVNVKKDITLLIDELSRALEIRGNFYAHTLRTTIQDIGSVPWLLKRATQGVRIDIGPDTIYNSAVLVEIVRSLKTWPKLQVDAIQRRLQAFEDSLLEETFEANNFSVRARDESAERYLRSRIQPLKKEELHLQAELTPPTSSPNIAETVVEFALSQVQQIPDALGRIVAMDQITREFMPAIYQEMMEDAAEFREAGGTWRQIGEKLGVTPQSAQQRFDPAARERRFEEQRARRTSEALKHKG